MVKEFLTDTRIAETQFTEWLRAILENVDQNPDIRAAIIRKIVHRIEIELGLLPKPLTRARPLACAFKSAILPLYRNCSLLAANSNGLAKSPNAKAPLGSEAFGLATPARFELATLCLEGRCSIQLSYGVKET
jgi:hypothetical protein